MLGTTLSGAFLLAFLLRAPLNRRLVLAAPIQDRPKRQFIVDLSLCLGAGSLVGVFNHIVHHFYRISALSLLSGCLVVGFFLGLDMALAREKEKEHRLRDNLRRSALPYDFVLIDCPPSVGLLTFNALLASNEVVIPVEPSSFSLQAVRKMRETLAVLREKKGHDLVPRILMSSFDTRPRFARKIMEELDELYESDLLDTIIHHTVRFREAVGLARPIVHLDPDSRGAADFRGLARELMDMDVDLSVVAIDHWSALLHGPRVSRAGVRFEADFPRARTVRITGTFCDWSAKGLPLNRREDGMWECHLDLGKGRHQYRFIVDGSWLPDPHNKETVPNEFGGANSLVVVG